jgi:hypothetical protein
MVSRSYLQIKPLAVRLIKHQLQPDCWRWSRFRRRLPFLQAPQQASRWRRPIQQLLRLFTRACHDAKERRQEQPLRTGFADTSPRAHARPSSGSCAHSPTYRCPC